MLKLSLKPRPQALHPKNKSNGAFKSSTVQTEGKVLLSPPPSGPLGPAAKVSELLETVNTLFQTAQIPFGSEHPQIVSPLSPGAKPDNLLQSIDMLLRMINLKLGGERLLRFGPSLPPLHMPHFRNIEVQQYGHGDGRPPPPPTPPPPSPTNRPEEGESSPSGPPSSPLNHKLGGEECPPPPPPPYSRDDSRQDPNPRTRPPSPPPSPRKYLL